MSVRDLKRSNTEETGHNTRAFDQCLSLPEILLSILLAREYSSSSSLESSQISVSLKSPVLDVQPLLSGCGTRDAHGGLRLSPSQSSIAGGVVEYVGGRDIRTLLRLTGASMSLVDAVVADEAECEVSLLKTPFTV
jgi:hypothetical protein